MQTTYSTPEWAKELVEQVCKDYKRALPTKLQWYQRTDLVYLKRVVKEDGSWFYTKGETSTSGTTWWNGKIHISAGGSVQDQKLVLLHELAHHIVMKTKKGKREHHSIRFWRLAFELYNRYGVDLDYSYEREKNYRVKATQAYKELTSKLAT